MIAKKPKDRNTTVPTRGFLPDFSRYNNRAFPIDDAYRNKDLINKLKLLVSELITTLNPAHDLQSNNICQKLELMRPGTDKDFLKKCPFPLGKVYYAAYGRNPYRIVFGIDSNQRKAYFLALDTKHGIRKHHGH